jgi:hypothetical protein
VAKWRKLPYFLTFLALAAAPALALARDCVETRLDKPSASGRPEEDGLLANVPIMDQDSTGSCFAYAAAQMADAYRFSNSDADRSHITSPVAAAVDYAKANGMDNLDGGSLGSTLSLIFDHGSCSYAKVGDRFGAYDLNGFLQGLRAYFNGLKSGDSDETAATIDLACYLNDRNFLPSNFSVEVLAKTLRKEGFMEFLHSSLAQVCKNNAKSLKKKPAIKAYQASAYSDASSRKKSFMAMMDEVKTPRSLPKGIYLCQDVITDRFSKGIDSSGEPTDECGTLHTMVMVGRRKNATGGCDILLRNSWGASCNGYDWPCERGQIWVDEDRLLDNMYGLVDYQ